MHIERSRENPFSPLPLRILRRVAAAVALAVAAGCGPVSELEQHATPAGVPRAGTGEPLGLFLTWQRDPTTTMTIDWHTPAPVVLPRLEYRRRGENAWASARAGSFPFPHSTRMIHRVELTGLAPDTEYEFRTGADAAPYRFRTMPARATRAVRFIAGGDVRHSFEMMAQTGHHAASYDPDFIVWGGDLAYANGLPERVDRWHECFDAILTAMVTPERRVIPVLLAIGNHEVAGSYHHHIDGYEQTDRVRARIAPFFFGLFASPGLPGYAAIDFGDYLSVVLLDTDHANPIDGEQTRWLDSVLAERRHVPHVFPIYHVPAYPSVRGFEGSVSARVREHWVPLFERYGVQVAFENHDHAYKRSHPLRQGRLDPEGVVYLGDGAWGTSTRPIGRDQGHQKAWYLARAESVRHFILGEIEGADRRFVMVDEDGSVFDEFPAGSLAAIGDPRFPIASAAAPAADELVIEEAS